MRPPEHLNDPAIQAVFANAEHDLIGDPVVYSEWWSRANEKRQKVAVGVRRWHFAKDKFGETPDWEYFVDPEDGSLLSLADLREETAEEMAARVGQVRDLMRERRAALRKAYLLQGA